MSDIIKVIVIAITLIVSSITYAIPVPPNITYNVTVMQNTAAAQCPSDWKGSVSPEIVNVVSGEGSDDESTSPGILSCTGCQFNANTRSCVCSTCYDDSDLETE